ncbi:MAG: amylo-alpha-1,6-glucosidase [Acidobacteria bacterium]|nr:MAG: amylo-alpha-1,6-glucosidase [Acidobacteriota bacterium]
MSEVSPVVDEFYILAGAAHADDRTHVLKHGETFGLFDHYGDIHPHGLGEQGVYHEGTRFLSKLDVRVGRKRPLFLSSAAQSNNELLAIDLANPDVPIENGLFIPRGTIHIFRSKFLWEGICYERLRISNFGLIPAHVHIAVEFDADFADIFEVRGARRTRRGIRHEPRVQTHSAVVLSYTGLDEMLRSTRITFTPSVHSLKGSIAQLQLTLEPKEDYEFFIIVECFRGDEVREYALSYPDALKRLTASLSAARLHETAIETSNEQFNAWLDRSIADVRMMVTETEDGPYPYAGVPWFSTVFGRDGIITAVELLWINPEIAKGVLLFLASNQATTCDCGSEAEPGKILHEMRQGEMAALGEIPFGKYYGTVDATPLFVILAGEYYRAVGDRDFVQFLWPHVAAALRWMDEYGDVDGDGFVEYSRQSEKGLVHQGWKDSQDSVFHADGMLAEGPIALCEVQGYVYAAKKSAAMLARVLGDRTGADEFDRQAKSLKQRFQTAFWCEELSTYVLALDRYKKMCRVRTSNAGHCLFTGIATPDRAKRLGAGLFGDGLFSGWGIRTVHSSELRYNPMSYHNGSIWPHDNAIIAQGLSRFGFKDLALRILEGMFNVSLMVDLHRLPELFCGFPRRHDQGPTLYPVACSPQSWAAGAVYMLLRSCLGMTLDAPQHRLQFEYPALPAFLDELHIRNLRVGNSSVDLTLRRYPDNVGINVDRRVGRLEIVVYK